jgi:hypothetical protein
MSKTKTKEILIPVDLAIELVSTLQAVSTNRQVPLGQKQLAAGLATLLSSKLKQSAGKEQFGVSVELIANILRIILMILIPDPIPNSEVKRISANNSDARKGS